MLPVKVRRFELAETVIVLAMRLKMPRPMPRTLMMSSMAWNGPWDARYSMMRRPRIAEMPQRVSSSV